MPCFTWIDSVEVFWFIMSLYWAELSWGFDKTFCIRIRNLECLEKYLIGISKFTERRCSDLTQQILIYILCPSNCTFYCSVFPVSYIFYPASWCILYFLSSLFPCVSRHENSRRHHRRAWGTIRAEVRNQTDALYQNGPIFSDFGPKSDFFRQNGPKTVWFCTPNGMK